VDRLFSYTPGIEYPPRVREPTFTTSTS
jgi:hypothetical protein